MWSTGLAVMTAHNNSLIDNQDRADGRIRTGQPNCTSRLVQGGPHKALIIFSRHSKTNMRCNGLP
jgi:hypothetical protein